MSIYKINYTNIDKPPIFLSNEVLNSTSLDITLIGQSTMEYGEIFDDNILHLLENFASYENPENPGNPNLMQVLSPLLQRPTEGQLWFNKGISLNDHANMGLFFWDGTSWKRFLNRDAVAGNSGILAHGYPLPRPVSGDGYEFEYSECVWIVSPQYVDSQSNYIECYTDTNAVVYSRYRSLMSNELLNGLANYMILGVKNSKTKSVEFPLPSIPLPPSNTPTPTLTPSITPTITPVAGASPTPTNSPTLTPSITLSPTVTHSPTLTRTPTPTITPSITVSKHVFTYILTAQQFGFTTQTLQLIGYNNTAQAPTPTFGNLSPVSLATYFISSIVCTTGPYFSIEILTPSGGLIAPSNVFTNISFIDNTGVAQLFSASAATITTSAVNGNNLKIWRWNITTRTAVNSFLFTPNSSYIIQIED